MFYKNLTHYAWNKWVSRETARKLLKDWKIVKIEIDGKKYVVEPVEIVKFFALKI